MASVYPGAIDTLATNKTNATLNNNDHPNHHNDMADAINKVETELGTNPSGAQATVKARLDAIDAAIAGVSPIWTVRVPIALRNPAQAAEAGGSYPNVTNFAAWEGWHWEFASGLGAQVHGLADVPFNLASPANAKVVLALSGGTAGTRNVEFYWTTVSTGLNYNSAWAGSLTNAVTISTAWARVDTSYTLNASLPTAGAHVICRVRMPATAPNIYLFGAYLEVDVSS